MNCVFVLMIWIWTTIANAEAKSVAVLEFRGLGVNTQLLAQLSEEARGGARMSLPNSQYNITSRESMNSMLEDMGKDMSAYDVECEVELGRVLQVDYVISGSVTKIDNIFILTLKLHETHTGSLMGQKTIRHADKFVVLDKTLEETKALVQNVLPLNSNASVVSHSQDMDETMHLVVFEFSTVGDFDQALLLQMSDQIREVAIHVFPQQTSSIQVLTRENLMDFVVQQGKSVTDFEGTDPVVIAQNINVRFVIVGNAYFQNGTYRVSMKAFDSETDTLLGQKDLSAKSGGDLLNQIEVTALDLIKTTIGPSDSDSSFDAIDPAAVYAVLDIKGLSSDRLFLSQVSEQLRSELFEQGKQIMTREQMSSLLSDLGQDPVLSMEGNAVEVGRLIQADYVVDSKLTEFDGHVILTVNLYATDTGRLVGRSSQKVKVRKMRRLMKLEDTVEALLVTE